MLIYLGSDILEYEVDRIDLAEEVNLYENRVTKRFEGKLTTGMNMICDIGEAPDGTTFVMKIHKIGGYYYAVDEDVEKSPHKSITISIRNGPNNAVPLKKAADDSWRIYSTSKMGPIRVNWEENDDLALKKDNFRFPIRWQGCSGPRCRWHQMLLAPEAIGSRT